jgi:uncharacterized protein
MLFIVRFTDNPERLAIRKEYLPAHLEWLKEHGDIVRVAGSLRPETDAAPVGAVWIVEANDKKEIEALLLSDPFWAEGLRQSVEILHWFKAFPDNQVAI